jgi:polyhydroxybutyrate depolymerase
MWLLCSVASVSVAARQAPLTRQAWTVDGVERTALVAAPKVAATGAQVPVVLVFHGHGGSSQNAARTFAIHTQWPEALVFYPQGLPTPGPLVDPEGRLPGWQSTIGAQADRDLHLVDAMLAWARAHYAVDATRIYAAGHSNGGSMTYVLWAARGKTFAAFAPAASIFRLDLLSRATPKPALIVAGEKDPLVPFGAQRRSLDAVFRLNRVSATGVAWAGGATMHASATGADVVAYIHPGAHAMPANAGELMVKFFKDHAQK